MLKIKDSVAVITGGASGLGLALSLSKKYIITSF